MTLSDFDPRLLDNYTTPNIYYIFNGVVLSYLRYALVEILAPNKINSKTKQKEDEQGISQEDIWKKYNIVVKKD
jgi:hypothetical protein